MALRRALRQRFGIAAPRVAVRPDVPWYWRGLGIAAVAIAVLWLAYDRGWTLPAALGDERGQSMSELNGTIERQAREISELQARAVGAERQAAIEHASRDDLARQIQSLADQNASLKEDLAFFQTLMPAGGGDRGILVERFRVAPQGAPGEYRYRLFLVQTGRRDEDFQGRIQLVVNAVEHGAPRALKLPPDNEAEAREYQLRFRFFQRIEGSFRLNPGAALKSVQVRVYQHGSRAPKLAQTINAT